MAIPLSRWAVAIAAAAALAGTAACDSKSEGVLRVIVIGDEPRLVQSSSGPLGTSEAILTNNAGQGLVRFDARGQIEPGLAEAWNVSDDGLSYIFRLAHTQWPDGREVTAEQVARILRRQIAPASENPLKDSLGVVGKIVAMTERVLEIRLNQPRPHLLQLLAQPEMGLVHEGQGSGPFAIEAEESGEGRLRIVREVPVPDEDDTEREALELSGATVQEAIQRFTSGSADLVLGGTFADLPYAQRAELSGQALRFDPAMGLFGLVPARASGLLANEEVRRLLSAAIDREALVAELAVPGLAPRATALEPGIDNFPDPQPPSWAATPMADRRAPLAAIAERLLEEETNPTLTIALPEGPGADIVFNRLAQDWRALGIEVTRASTGERADLELIDRVAPANSASWYIRHFRCEVAPVCDETVDELLNAARSTPIVDQRNALLAEASRQVDSKQLFLPLAAPIRWSLVSPRVTGFAGNRFAIHTLTGLEKQLLRTGE